MQAKVERHKVLADYVSQFWNAYSEGLKNLRANTPDLVVEGQRVAVVEVSATEIVYRDRGKNKRKSLGELRTPTILAIADSWFDNSPANKVMKGAFHAVSPEGDRVEARRLWQEAQRSGVDIGDLISVLDDSY